jgi:competence protein ComEC
MRCTILGFALGAAWLQLAANLPAPATMLGAASVALLLLAGLRGVVRAVLAGALLGWTWAALLAHIALAPELARADEGRDIAVVGTVASLPYRFDQGVRFDFAVERVVGGNAAVPPRIALGWYTGFRGHAHKVAEVQPGERWQLVVRLQRPHGNANPYGFDYEAWLLEQGVRATGYVRGDDPANGRIDAFVPGFSNVVERGRALLRARILAALPGKPYAGVIVALVIGDQRAIDQRDWTVFNRTGISHLVSISGLHITMVAGLFAAGASWLWRRSFFTGAQLPLLLPAQKVAALAGFGAGLLYVLLAGFGVPAQRTLYMLAVVALAAWTGRLANVSQVLCLSLGVVVLLDPWSVLAPGFWLSFGAVAIILYASTGRTAGPEMRWDGLRAAVHTQYVVTLGLVPLTLLLFAQVSIVSPLANAIAIPVVSFVVTPLALLGSLLPSPLSEWLLLVAHGVVAALAGFLDWAGAQPFAVWTAPVPPPWIFAFAMFGTLWMLAPRGWPHRWTGAIAWLPLLAALPSHPAPGQMRVTAFDVGQGMALLLETSGHRLLYDTGPFYSPESNGGNRVIVPYLHARGIGRLDGLIVTHSDADHSGGALAVMEAVTVDWVLSSLWASHPIVKASKVHARCIAGQQWEWDGVQFEMLQPGLASYGDPSLKPNARGCTLKVTAAGHAILLAADIEAAQEAQLVSGMPERLHADVLLAPHHGSGTSSTPVFLDAVGPALAVFQVGCRNRYHHPKKEVFERYGARRIERVRTDESGAVVLEFDGSVRMHTYRKLHPRYWYDSQDCYNR